LRGHHVSLGKTFEKVSSHLDLDEKCLAWVLPLQICKCYGN